MRNFYFTIIAFFAVLSVHTTANAQITVNGRNPRRDYFGQPPNSLTLSYSALFWVDGKNEPLLGYSASSPFASSFAGLGALNAEKLTASGAVTLGFQHQLSEKSAVHITASYSKLSTGMLTRLDLIAEDKSKIAQLGVYLRQTLSKDVSHRVLFHWFFGTELISAHRNVIIQDYVLTQTDTPAQYEQDISIVEVALMTGPGLSLKLSDKLSLYTDSKFGIALPGKGFKATATTLGLGYKF